MARKRLGARRDDRGVAIVLYALLLVVLMVFAAFAVDIGAAYSQRRRNQSAADMAALAGGLKFMRSGDFGEAISQIEDVAGKNLAAAPTAEQWQSCQDPDPLKYVSTSLSSNGSPCISFGLTPNAGTMRVRVRLPDVSQATVFAGIIGLDSIETTALAEAKFGGLPGGGTLPAWVLSNATAGQQICAFNAPGGQNVPCAGQTSGNFGGFQPYYYQVEGCPSGDTGSGNANSPARAIAVGLDHLLVPYGNYPAGPQRVNRYPCPAGPNTVVGSNGFSNASVLQGLITGGDSFSGRLAGGPYGGSAFAVAEIDGVRVDNAPLWYFIASGVADDATFPEECQVAATLSPDRDTVMDSFPRTVGSGTTAIEYTSPEDLMSACLAKWKVADGDLFDNSIINSQRFGSVPRFYETSPISGNGLGHIKDFVPVFLNEESLGTGNHTTTHHAGASVDTGGKTKLVAEGAVLVPCLSLPGDVCQQVIGDSASPGDNGLGGVLGSVNLSQ